MKLSNIFKKATKTVATANIEKLEKKQLEKVIGGAEDVGKSIPVGAGTSGTTQRI